MNIVEFLEKKIDELSAENERLRHAPCENCGWAGGPTDRVGCVNCPPLEAGP